MKRLVLCAVALTALTVVSAPADEKLKGIACRSVHLGYPAPEGVAFYTEMAVEKSADGTYFMAAGWGKGYFGIQELAVGTRDLPPAKPGFTAAPSGKKVVIFSVWDPTAGDDPKKVDDTKRVKMLHKDAAVRVGRFGGEGTGGQSFFDYDWKVDETYRFLVAAKADGDARTAYSGYFYVPENKEWKHLVTFSTVTKGELLRGYYSFVEDFRRNKVSTTKERRAALGNGWVKTDRGEWVSLDKARFTADSNPVLNIDAGATAGRYFLATGGDIENKTTKLKELIARDNEKTEGKPPADLPRFE